MIGLDLGESAFETCSMRHHLQESVRIDQANSWLSKQGKARKATLVRESRDVPSLLPREQVANRFIFVIPRPGEHDELVR